LRRSEELPNATTAQPPPLLQNDGWLEVNIEPAQRIS
jgi:hypothetical protein